MSNLPVLKGILGNQFIWICEQNCTFSPRKPQSFKLHIVKYLWCAVNHLKPQPRPYFLGRWGLRVSWSAVKTAFNMKEIICVLNISVAILDFAFHCHEAATGKTCSVQWKQPWKLNGYKLKTVPSRWIVQKIIVIVWVGVGQCITQWADRLEWCMELPMWSRRIIYTLIKHTHTLLHMQLSLSQCWLSLLNVVHAKNVKPRL